MNGRTALLLIMTVHVSAMAIVGALTALNRLDGATAVSLLGTLAGVAAPSPFLMWNGQAKAAA